MKYILLTFKNIKKFLQFHPVLFLFLLAAQIVCCVAVFISCGMAYNMNYAEEKHDESQGFAISFVKNEDGKSIEIVRGENNEILEQHYVKLDPETREKIYYDEEEHSYSVPMDQFKNLIMDFISQISKYEPQGGFVRVSQNVITTVGVSDQQFISVIPISDELKKDSFISSDERIFIAPTELHGEHNPYCPYYIGEIYNLGGVDFKCSGYSEDYRIPYNVLPDSFVVDFLSIGFDNNLYEEDINEINTIAESVFGNKIQEKILPEPIEPFQLQLSQMLFVISISVMVIVVLTIAKFYSFILANRRSTLAVLRLCGCTRSRVHAIYMLEIIITLILSTASGFLIFRYLLFDTIAKMYPSFKQFFSYDIILVIIAAYFVLSLLIMSVTIIPATKVSIKEMEGKK